MNPIDTHPERLHHFAVIVCTRDRPQMARAAVDSILEGRPCPGILVIVDQADPESNDPFRDLDERPDVIRIRHQAHGLSRARNVGAEAAAAAGASFVAYTDDDCTVSPAWLSGFAATFAMAGDVALVFGTTRAAGHDAESGMIPAYVVPRDAILRGLGAKHHAEGMGACMAVRNKALLDVGGFDDRLGAGTPLAAAEENDLSVRMLLAGYAVAETPDAEVIHHGFRDRSAAVSLQAGYMRGTGAATAKMVRLGGVSALRPLAAMGRRWLAGRPAVTIGHMPSRRARLRSFLEGAVDGWSSALDRRSGRFLPFNGPNDLLPVEPSIRHSLNHAESGPSTTPRTMRAQAPPPPTPPGLIRGIAGAIRRHQMVWLFDRRLAGWMRDRSLRCQLPALHQLFALYCVTWMTLLKSRWIIGGKQAFFLLSSLHRLLGGPREFFLKISGGEVGIDLADPRYIKVVHEVLPGSTETAVLGSLLAEGDTFIDIGANHGAYSLVAARIVGSTGAIVAFEAQPRLAGLLRRALTTSVDCRCQVHAVALGDCSGQVPFYLLRRNSGQSGLFRGSSTEGVHSVTEVPLVRLDDVLDWRDLPGRIVVKLDVEGAEDRVLAGASAFISARRPVFLMEVNPGCMAAAGVTWEMLEARLQSLGYNSCSEADWPRRMVSLKTLDPTVQRDIIVWPADPTESGSIVTAGEAYA